MASVKRVGLQKKFAKCRRTLSAMKIISSAKRMSMPKGGNMYGKDSIRIQLLQFGFSTMSCSKYASTDPQLIQNGPHTKCEIRCRTFHGSSFILLSKITYRTMIKQTLTKVKKILVQGEVYRPFSLLLNIPFTNVFMKKFSQHKQPVSG